MTYTNLLVSVEMSACNPDVARCFNIISYIFIVGCNHVKLYYRYKSDIMIWSLFEIYIYIYIYICICIFIFIYSYIWHRLECIHYSLNAKYSTIQLNGIICKLSQQKIVAVHSHTFFVCHDETILVNDVDFKDKWLTNTIIPINEELQT